MAKRIAITLSALGFVLLLGYCLNRIWEMGADCRVNGGVLVRGTVGFECVAKNKPLIEGETP